MPKGVYVRKPRPYQFWSRVNVVLVGSACWEWQRGKTAAGYGRIGKRDYAHRRAYELAVGPVPEGMFVCHHCDNPGCVRPDHLFLGTPKDNMVDKHRKGRAFTQTHPDWGLCGSINPAHALSEVNVVDICIRHSFGESAVSLAEEFSVSEATVWAILAGRNWGWLTGGQKVQQDECPRDVA